MVPVFGKPSTTAENKLIGHTALEKQEPPLSTRKPILFFQNLLVQGPHQSVVLINSAAE